MNTLSEQQLELLFKQFKLYIAALNSNNTEKAEKHRKIVGSALKADTNFFDYLWEKLGEKTAS